MNITQVRERLRVECEKVGGQATWGRLHGVSPAYISDVIRGAQEPGAKVLKALRLKRVNDYVPDD